jgi:hypothetical protein
MKQNDIICETPFPEPTGLDFTYALPYSSLQEIHVLIGMVYGSKMNLPIRMIVKAKQVHSLMLNLARTNDYGKHDCKTQTLRAANSSGKNAPVQRPPDKDA